jgi:glucokinase
MILAGDIGGTNTRLALFEPGAEGAGPEGLRRVAATKVPSRGRSGLAEIARTFLEEHARGARVAGAAFGIAGPVRGGRAEGTNLPWVVDARELERDLGLAPGSVALLNDLEANAYGIEGLAPGDVLTLHEGAPDPRGNRAIISAGTGLGEAGIDEVEGRYIPVATEGGHCTFAPRDETEIELLRHLLRTREHVSWEHVVSGPGLVNVYSFLRDTGRGEEPGWLADEIASGDPAGAISRAALAHRSPLAEAALDLFVSLYGHEASNVALKHMATGGLYVGGGIAPKIVARLREGPFLPSFFGKGRMRALLEAVPVRVILNDGTALLGAARVAAGIARASRA